MMDDATGARIRGLFYAEHWPVGTIALAVNAKESGCCLGLTAELGVGVRSRFFDVEVHGREIRRRRRGRHIRGIGDFVGFRQRRLAPDDN